jgi:uncharacterized iron-regulated membrane protein
VPISFPWGNALVYRAVGEAPPAAGRGGGGREGGAAAAGRQGGAPAGGTSEGADNALSLDGLDALLARAAEHAPGWRTINLRIPASDRAPVVFAIDRGDGGQPHLRSTLTLDRASGRIVSDETFSSLTLGRRIRNTMRFAHTGEVLGIPGQTVAGLVTFGSLVLAWTGIALTLRRFRGWLRRRHSGSVAVRDANAA